MMDGEGSRTVGITRNVVFRALDNLENTMRKPKLRRKTGDQNQTLKISPLCKNTTQTARRRPNKTKHLHLIKEGHEPPRETHISPFFSSFPRIMAIGRRGAGTPT